MFGKNRILENNPPSLNLPAGRQGYGETEKYMTLQLEKFGKTLISRELGGEALKAFQSTLRELAEDEVLEINFSGVLTLSPSWADEFLSPLLNQLGDRLVLLSSDNLSVQATLKILEEVNKQPFKNK
mgnify:CR=1 FL=1